MLSAGLYTLAAWSCHRKRPREEELLWLPASSAIPRPRLFAQAPSEPGWPGVLASGGTRDQYFQPVLGDHCTVFPVAPWPYHFIALAWVPSPPKHRGLVPSERLQFFLKGWSATKFEWKCICQNACATKLSCLMPILKTPHSRSIPTNSDRTTPHLFVQA